MARPREHLVGNLEQLYREQFARAQAAGDEREMARLDFAFRRDQLYFEAILDVRDQLSGLRTPAAEGQQKGDRSVIEQINELRGLAKLPFGR